MEQQYDSENGTYCGHCGAHYFEFNEGEGAEYCEHCGAHSAEWGEAELLSKEESEEED